MYCVPVGVKSGNTEEKWMSQEHFVKFSMFSGDGDARFWFDFLGPPVGPS